MAPATTNSRAHRTMRKQPERHHMKNSIFSLAAVLALTGSALADSTSEGKVLVLKNRGGLALHNPR